MRLDPRHVNSADRIGPEHAATRQPEDAAASARTNDAGAREVASAIGNRAFSEHVAGPGAGILDGGRVHADVEQGIASTRGGGAPLEHGTRERLAAALGDSLADVRVHADGNADALARSLDARAFATGSDLYFARGEYRPGSGEGDHLLAHELAHVVQQRGAPASGPMVVSQPGDALETEADAAADAITG